MVFSDTTDKKGLIQDCELRTGLGDAGISGDASTLDHFVRWINQRYHEVVTMVLESQDDWDFDDINLTDYPIVTTSLVANQRDYTIPASEKVLKLKRLDVCYDGTGNTCYEVLPMDPQERQFGFGNDTEVDGRFSTSAPKYDLQGNAIWLYPRATAANVTNGGVLRAHWTREIDEFTDTDTTQEPGIDKPFRKLLSIGACIDWAESKGDPREVQWQDSFDRMEARLRKYYGSKQGQRNYALKSDYVDYN